MTFKPYHTSQFTPLGLQLNVKRPLPFILLAFTAAVWLVSGCGSTQGTQETTLTLGTFNVEWLGDGIADRVQRSDADYLAVADIIIKSRADVMGLQEIENQAALDKILRYLEGYKGLVLEEDNKQCLAVVYRNDVTVKSFGAYRPLQLDNPSRLRPGFVIRCSKGGFDWTQMIVHLKSTSRYDSTSTLRELSQQYREQQVRVVQTWADSIVASGEADVVISGDFNDYPQRTKNATLTPMLDAGTLLFVTKDVPNCRNPRWHAIDHVVTSKSFEPLLVSGSERTENFYEFLTESEAAGVSDHCPVVARFLLPVLQTN